MNEDTQPLAPEQAQIWEQVSKARKAWDDLINHPLVQAFRAEKEQDDQHIHGPFTFLMNQNHNALRGCTTCGATWIGLMAGNVESLCWHPVYEVEEGE